MNWKIIKQALIVVGIVVVGSAMTIFAIAGYIGAVETRTIIDKQNALVKNTTEEDNQRKEAQMLIEQSKTSQWRNNVDATNMSQDAAIWELTQKLKSIMPSPKSTVGVPIDSHREIIINIIDAPSGNDITRTTLHFYNVADAILYLEGLQ